MIPITPKILSVVPHANHTLTIAYENGEKRVFDVTPLLNYPVYHTLRDLAYFKQVQPYSRTVVWPGEEDIAPERLYWQTEHDYPEHRQPDIKEFLLSMPQSAEPLDSRRDRSAIRDAKL